MDAARAGREPAGGGIDTMEANNLTTRRNFYQRVIYSIGAVISAALALPAMAYLFLPPRGRSETGWTEAGDVSTLTPNKPEEMVFQKKRVDGWKESYQRATAWVVKTEREIIAFTPQCTHLGCGYRWDGQQGRFLCPCHASTFSIEGEVLTGPAPRPLDRYRSRVEGTRLWLGKVAPSPGETGA